MSKVISALRKNSKLILISAVILAFIVIFAVLNTESMLEILKLCGISALFTLGAAGVSMVLSIPSIIFKITKKRAAKLSGKLRVLLVLLFIVLLVAPIFILDAIPNTAAKPDSKTGEYPSIYEKEYMIKFPQAFIEDQYAMTFGIYSFIFAGVILAFAGNLMILTWENHDSNGAKVAKISMGLIFAILLHCALVYMDYVSTMLSFNYFTTVGIAGIIGMYIGYGVYGKIQDSKDRKLRAKGL